MEEIDLAVLAASKVEYVLASRYTPKGESASNKFLKRYSLN